jgi:site-specific recombinase XerD
VTGELARVDTAVVVHRSADWELSATTAARIERAPSPHTLRAYRKWIADFTTWCHTVGRTSLPATPQTLAEYVSHLADRNKGIPTIHIAVAAIRFQHAGAGYEKQPTGKLSTLVARTHARERADAGARTGQATPILIDTLRAMVDTCPSDTARGQRDRLILVLGWSAMLRRSELAALQLGDITQTSDGLTIFIARSKTDKEAKGAWVPIPHGTHPDTDPARVWQTWVDTLHEYAITTGPLLRRISQTGHIGDRITGDGINDIVRSIAARAGLTGSYTAHSLRAGGATAAYKAGAVVSSIAEHGRWAKNSPVVLGYIRSVDKWRDNPMRGIGL